VESGGIVDGLPDHGVSPVTAAATAACSAFFNRASFSAIPVFKSSISLDWLCSSCRSA
jgi:hypothetical protein